MVGDNYRMSPSPLIYDLDLHRLCTQGADKILFYRSYEIALLFRLIEGNTDGIEPADINHIEA